MTKCSIIRTFAAIIFLSHVVVFPKILFSQISPPLYSQNSGIRLSYNQDNNIFFWKGDASVKKRISKGIFLFQNNVEINRIKLQNLQDKWKDVNRISSEYRTPIKGELTAAAGYRLHYLSDRQTGFLNNINEHEVFFQTPYSSRQWQIVPQIGYKYDKRSLKADNGAKHGVQAVLYETPAGEYNFSGKLDYYRENLSSRRNEIREFSASVNRTFYNNTADTLNYMNSHQRRDYYTSLSGELESRRESFNRISNSLSYNLFDRAVMQVSGNYSTGSVDFSSLKSAQQNSKTSRDDRKTGAGLSVVTLGAQRTYSLHFTIENMRQDYFAATQQWIFGSVPFDIPDNESTRLSAGVESSGKLIKNHRYDLQSYIEKLRYDTPSKDNYDDRDEFRFKAQGMYSIPINPLLTVQFNSLASLEHIVYVFSQRSADNNWNRIFQAGSQVDYRNSAGMKITSSYSVLANYIDYDFDALFLQVRSFVFRKFSMNHQVYTPITERGSIEANIQLSLEENGQLRWEDFVQNITIDRSILNGSIKYNFKINSQFKIIPGVTSFKRSETHHQNRALAGVERRLFEIRDTGISFEAEYRTSAASSINFSAFKRFITRETAQEQLQYININVNWTF